jgi:ATP-dependent helicase YprA (DUF1998 family)
MDDALRKNSYRLLDRSRAASKGYDSRKPRVAIKKTCSDAFNGLEPFDWQTDVCEAILLGLDVVLIAGTGAGKTLPFAMPLLMDQTKRKMVIVISPLNALEHDQVSTSDDHFQLTIYVFRLNGLKNWVSRLLRSTETYGARHSTRYLHM